LKMRSGAALTPAPWAAWPASRTCAPCASQIAACCSLQAFRPRPRTRAWRALSSGPRTLRAAHHARHSWALRLLCCSGDAQACFALWTAMSEAQDGAAAASFELPWRLRGTRPTTMDTPVSVPLTRHPLTRSPLTRHPPARRPETRTTPLMRFSPPTGKRVCQLCRGPRRQCPGACCCPLYSTPCRMEVHAMHHSQV